MTTASKALSHRALTNDVEVSHPPEDSISELSFSSVADHLAVASWDSKVRIYEISPSGGSKPITWFDLSKPVLSCSWSKDGAKIAAGGVGNTAQLIDIPTSQVILRAQHDNAVSRVRMTTFNGNPMLVTGSWDKTVKYWDSRSPTVAGTLACGERVYALDVDEERVVCGTAKREIQFAKMNDPLRMASNGLIPVPEFTKGQLRNLACFRDGLGFAYVTTGGKCRLEYYNDASKSFQFSCHRRELGPQDFDIFSANTVSHGPTNQGICVTGGSDGAFTFWDCKLKSKVTTYPDCNDPIVSTSFNRSGAILAYARSYDWSKGYAGHTTNSVTRIMLHPVSEEENKSTRKTMPLNDFRRRFR